MFRINCIEINQSQSSDIFMYIVIKNNHLGNDELS
jgi:hypothetical protein